MEVEGVDVNEDVFQLEAEESSTKAKEKAERETMEVERVDVNEDVFQLKAEELSTEVEEKAEREAMEAEGVDVNGDVFQLEAEESSTKVEEKAESSETSPGADMKMFMAALSQLSSQLSSQMSQMASEISSQFKLHMSQRSKMFTELSSKLDAQLERINVEQRKVETDEDEVHQADEKEIADTAEDQSDVIKEMLVEVDQSVVIDNLDGDGEVIKYEDYNVEAEKTHEATQLEAKKTNATLSSAIVSNETENEEDADAVDETENEDDADDAVSSSAIELVEDDSHASGEEKESMPLAKRIRVNVEVDDSLDAEQSEKPLSQPKTNSGGRRLWDRGKSKLFTWRDWLHLGRRTWCLIGTIRLKRRAVLRTRTFAKRLVAMTFNE